MAWMTKPFKVFGRLCEVHVVPINDRVPHTIPMCWCKPKPDGKGSALFSHNALDPTL